MLEPSWGSSWGFLGASLGPSGRSKRKLVWAIFGRPSCGHFGPCLGPPWSHRGSSWGFLGLPWGQAGGPDASSLGPFSGGHRGVILRPCWGHLAATRNGKPLRFIYKAGFFGAVSAVGTLAVERFRAELLEGHP